MAFLLGSLFVIPSVMYGVHEVSKTLDDIISFNYSEYFANKISRVDKNMQIIILEIEYKRAKMLYEECGKEYKRLILEIGRTDDKRLADIKLKRVHYNNLMHESRRQIRALKNEIIN